MAGPAGEESPGLGQRGCGTQWCEDTSEKNARRLSVGVSFSVFGENQRGSATRSF